MMASGRVFCTLPARTFSRKKQKDAKSATFSAFPVGVDFYGLLKQKADNVLPSVSNQDLFNTVIALYDVCLPDIGVENLRTIVFERGAKTILLLRDQQEVLKEYQDRCWPELEVPDKSPVVHEVTDEEECAGTLSAVFSDPESSEEEEDSDSDDEEEIERFHSILEEFLTMVRKRRHQRRQPDPTPDSIGIECCLVAALTFKKCTAKSKEKILEVTLLSTRRRYRNCGVATYLIKLLKDVSLVGFYDAIVTHADSHAVDLFERCDFSDDVILNNKFRDLEYEWVNTTTMSYYPPFSTGLHTRLDVGDLELQMTQWRAKSFAAHESQTVFMKRILCEIKALRKQVTSQKKEIRKLTTDLEKERQERKLLRDHKEDTILKTPHMQDLVHRSIEIDGCQLELQEIVQAALSWQISDEIKSHMSTLPVCQRLYYCGGRSQPERLVEILRSGFSPGDFQQGEYGTGLYFSASPAVAINLLPPHHVLVADVCLQRTQEDGVKTACRTSPPRGVDSALVPGRPTTVTSPLAEFVIYSHLQAIPICLLKYTQKGSPVEDHT
ncbi:uncharacterized protein LOC142104325 isoform X2 [Mixophyes fleayi]|uniref:uncharacterized protein LOC142104325 isoform X2 n=1 Tax=Mixophyes fleayi TaxID=3061075 RepID=UPI003F4D8747